MSDAIRYGERLFLPVLTRPWFRDNEERPEEPTYRPLWVYVLDPARTGLRNTTARLEVPYEPLTKGIKGVFFEVPDDPLPDFMCKHLDWPQRLVDDFNQNRLDLDDPQLAMRGGMTPCTGQPRFAGQMVYAVCQRVYTTFREALGRYPTFGPWVMRRLEKGESTALRLRPFAREEANAYYDWNHGTLDFGVFRTDVKAKSQYVLPGGVVMLALSHDVIAHEVAHALLDGMRAHFQLNTHYDVPAFHEAFADIVALFHHFQYRDMVAQSIEEHGTVDSNMLLQLAREFGEALHGSEGSSLRHAIRPGGTEVDELSYKSDSAKQPHKRGSILVAAVFSAYLSVYQKRSNSLIRLANLTHREGGAQRWMPSDLVKLLADEACRLASDFLHVCIQAIDYCPPLDVRFGDYLRAIVTADRMLDPEDEDGIRDALIKEFRRREIDFGRVRDLSEFSLEWNSPFPEKRPQVPDLAWSRLRFQNDGITPLRTEEVERQASALGEFVLGQVRDYRLAREFGVSPVGGEFGPVTVESIRPVVKRGRQGAIKHGLVAELAQPRDAASGRFWGGSTIIVDAEGRIQFSIRKSADDERMIQQADYRQSTGAPQTLSFRDLHSTTTEKE